MNNHKPFKMKKLSLLLFFLTVVLYGQKKSVGKVFSEHPLISISDDFWKAYQNNDEKYIKTIVADNFIYTSNDENFRKQSLNRLLGESSWASNRFKNLTVKNANGWVSDAIRYDNGETWILSWKRWQGIDTKTGIRINSFLHTQMRINKNKKVDFVNVYSDQADFIQMFESENTRQNGVVYDSHPSIVTVRKVVAHYLNKEFDDLRSYFDENAQFWNSTMDTWDEKLGLEERVSALKQDHETYSEIYMNEQGKPIAIKYEGSDNYFVDAWWNMYVKKGEDWMSIPFKSSHSVDPNGKILSESLYFSTNRLEKKMN